jgi:hypothetical protein
MLLKMLLDERRKAILKAQDERVERPSEAHPAEGRPRHDPGATHRKLRMHSRLLAANL